MGTGRRNVLKKVDTWNTQRERGRETTVLPSTTKKD
jgi:hypothetical protein